MKNPLTLAIGLVLIIIFATLLLCGQVRKSTVVVITTFGSVSSTLSEPGFYVKWPPPIQQAYVLDQRIQNFDDDKLEEGMTSDKYPLLTMIYVGWKISDATNFFPKFAYGSVTEAEKQLKPLLRSAKSAVVGNHPLADFVSTDQNQLKFEVIEQEILKKIQDQVNQKNWGIEKSSSWASRNWASLTRSRRKSSSG
jgi:regulator of protease activity HflC (stomatin/prohibitin superfamily)